MAKLWRFSKAGEAFTTSVGEVDNVKNATEIAPANALGVYTQNPLTRNTLNTRAGHNGNAADVFHYQKVQSLLLPNS